MDRSRGQATGSSFEEETREAMPESRVARLHLLRHAAVEDAGRRVVRGQMETNLAPEAERQEEALVAWFTRTHPAPARVITSDLGRCVRLAERLGRAADVPVEPTERLREQSMGRWEGLTWDEITQADPDLVRAYWEDYVHTVPPGGESFAQLVERVDGWWSEALPELLDRRTVVVTHVGVIRALVVRRMGIATLDALRFAPAFASHTEFLWSAPGAVLECLGERPWSWDS